ncbi:MAG TPA: hypothetical protein VIU11_08260 [Nakamurella sp.]
MLALKTRLSRYDPARYEDAGVVAVRRRNPRARHWPAVVAAAAVVGALGVSVWVARSGADGPTPADSADGQGLTTVTQIDGVDVITGTLPLATRSFTEPERAAWGRAVLAAEQDAGLGVPDYDVDSRVLTIRYVSGHETAADTLAAGIRDSTAGAIRIVVEPAEHSYQELEALVHHMAEKAFREDFSPLNITSTYINTKSGRAVVVVDSMDEELLSRLASTIDPTATEIRYSDEHFTKATGPPS